MKMNVKLFVYCQTCITVVYSMKKYSDATITTAEIPWKILLKTKAQWFRRHNGKKIIRPIVILFD